MQLWYAPSSPFARKVRIVIHELDLVDRIAPVEVDPWSDARLRSLNPLSKVPTLLRDEGPPLFESAVICEYLNALAGGAMLPPDGEKRWQVLLLQGLADGLCTAAGRLYAEQRRPPGQQPAAMMSRFAASIEAGLAQLSGTVVQLDAAAPTVAEAAVGSFLAYLDFRWPGHAWRHGHASLADWFARFAERPSMLLTGYRLLAA